MEYLEHGKETPIVKVENLSNMEQMIQNGGIQKNLNSKTQSTDSNLRIRCEGSGKTKDLPTLTPRVELLSRPFTALPKWNIWNTGKKNLSSRSKIGGIQKNLNSKTQSTDSYLRPRCEGSGKTKDLPTLAPRVKARNETRNPPGGGR
ncbi:hypothetical protein AVEN_234013-1 [Araneus ventricosus]|uniref:Uncharacterized protein n=1 Tax=Araneus ventricosus TaxID=182803 RepID=A0A4Y2U311_ARAVE|nr:hypothetical protein AVEN_234013-1 [Araneus ventricosus]